MAQLVSACPSCSCPMAVRRLECPACGVGLDGHFDAGPFARLNRDQIAFVEVFLRARGKIKDVEDELGISYPTVVARLNEVLASLGFPEGDLAGLASSRQRVLDELAAGRLSADAAAGQLRALGGRDD